MATYNWVGKFDSALHNTAEQLFEALQRHAVEHGNHLVTAYDSGDEEEVVALEALAVPHRLLVRLVHRLLQHTHHRVDDGDEGGAEERHHVLFELGDQLDEDGQILLEAVRVARVQQHVRDGRHDGQDVHVQAHHHPVQVLPQRRLQLQLVLRHLEHTHNLFSVAIFIQNNFLCYLYPWDKFLEQKIFREK